MHLTRKTTFTFVCLQALNERTEETENDEGIHSHSHIAIAIAIAIRVYRNSFQSILIIMNLMTQDAPRIGCVFYLYSYKYILQAHDIAL